jgi:internalin A
MRSSAFISYSSKDKQWLCQLLTMLTPAIRNGLKIWSDQEIPAGALWRQEIHNALAAAKVAVLLVSVEFLASEFIHTVELPSLLEAAASEGLTVLWVPIDFNLVDQTPIHPFQAAHDPEQPLISLSEAERSRALRKIGQRVIAAMNGEVG